MLANTFRLSASTKLCVRTVNYNDTKSYVGLKGFAICEVRSADNLLDCFGEAFIDHRFNRLLVQLEFVDDTETLFYDFLNKRGGTSFHI